MLEYLCVCSDVCSDDHMTICQIPICPYGLDRMIICPYDHMVQTVGLFKGTYPILLKPRRDTYLSYHTYHTIHTIWELPICPDSSTSPFNAFMPYYTILYYTILYLYEFIYIRMITKFQIEHWEHNYNLKVFRSQNNLSRHEQTFPPGYRNLQDCSIACRGLEQLQKQSMLGYAANK